MKTAGKPGKKTEILTLSGMEEMELPDRKDSIRKEERKEKDGEDSCRTAAERQDEREPERNIKWIRTGS